MMLCPEYSIYKIKDDIESAVDTEELKKFKEEINKLIDQQISKVLQNNQQVIQVRHIEQTKYTDSGYFVVEKGNKAEIEINGFMYKSEVIEKIECKRKGTKKFDTILTELKEKYKPYKISV